MGTPSGAIEEAIIGNINHLSKLQSLHSSNCKPFVYITENYKTH
jgi:hypothetical protein